MCLISLSLPHTLFHCSLNTFCLLLSLAKERKTWQLAASLCRLLMCSEPREPSTFSEDKGRYFPFINSAFLYSGVPHAALFVHPFYSSKFWITVKQNMPWLMFSNKPGRSELKLWFLNWKNPSQATECSSVSHWNMPRHHFQHTRLLPAIWLTQKAMNRWLLHCVLPW